MIHHSAMMVVVYISQSCPGCSVKNEEEVRKVEARGGVKKERNKASERDRRSEASFAALLLLLLRVNNEFSVDDGET